MRSYFEDHDKDGMESEVEEVRAKQKKNKRFERMREGSERRRVKDGGEI